MEDIFVASKENPSPNEEKSETTGLEAPAVESQGIPKAQDLPTAIEKNPLGNLHFLSSLSEYPAGISFENQEKDEKIILFVRRARLLNLRWFFITIALLVLPLISYPFINFGAILSALNFKFVIFYALLYYLVIGTYVFINFITWYFNMALVTNLRIIDIDFSGLMSKDVAITKLSLVQDVSFTQVGVLRNMLNYGDILVQTAGSLDNFRFESAPNPEKIARIIEGLIGKHGSI